MGIAEIKESLSKMNLRQRRAIRSYLNDLETDPKPGTVAWKKEMARRIDEANAGKFYTMDEVRAKLERRKR